jgi:hypothetical protein
MVAACVAPLPLYRPRDPQASDLWRLLDEHFETFQQVYDERFAAKYGFPASDRRTLGEGISEVRRPAGGLRPHPLPGLPPGRSSWSFVRRPLLCATPHFGERTLVRGGDSCNPRFVSRRQRLRPGPAARRISGATASPLRCIPERSTATRRTATPRRGPCQAP